MSTNQYLPPTGRAGDTDKPTIDDHEFGALVNLVRSNQRDSDRLRIIRNELVSYTVTCSQVAQLIKEIEFQDAKAEAAAELYSGTIDREQFESLVLTSLQFEQQREKVRQQVGLTPASSTPTSTAAKAPPPKPAFESKSETSWLQRKPANDSDSDSD